MKKQRLTKQEYLCKYRDIVSEKQLDCLSFDYFNHTYPRGKLLPKQDLQYLYIELNLNPKEISDCIGYSAYKIGENLRKHKIHKNNKQLQQAKKRNNIKKYGVDCPQKLDHIKEKSKKTCLEKYGVHSTALLSNIREKAEQTNLKKYGVKWPSQNKEIRDQQKQTCIKHFGHSCALLNKEIQEKSKNTCLEKYGVQHPSQAKEIKEKIKLTCNKKYNGNAPMCSEKIKEKTRQTCLQKYGETSYSKTKEFKIKTRNTQKIKNSFQKSKPEEYIYKKLCTKFFNVDRQHYDEQKYPFKCDFYIVDTDTFIEYQGYIGHGKEPFDPTKPEHMETIVKWKNKSQEINIFGKTKERYTEFIKTWTIKDPLKRKTAKENNLNWIEFFNLQEFDDWFNKQ